MQSQTTPKGQPIGNGRQLTAQRVARTLKAAIIPTKGPNRLGITGRGNLFVRENGTEVMIFNLQAFATKDDAEYASAEWKKGLALEKAGDLDGAQEHFKAALNQTMSFSVLAENAPAFQAAYEINCSVEDVPASQELQDAGTKTVLGINNPRPIAVVKSGTSAANLFEVDEEDTTPATDTGKPAAGKANTEGIKGASRRRRGATA